MAKFSAVPEFDKAFLDALATEADEQLDEHLKIRTDWSYHDTLDRETIAELAEQAPVEVDPEVRAIYLGNLAVEKGHAEYDRITAERFEDTPSFRKWKNIWISEEEQHGAAMLEWGKIRGLFAPQNLKDLSEEDADTITMANVHTIISGFLKNGLTLRFSDAAHGLAYPALQEPATKITHREVKNRLPEDEKAGRKILSKIAADEERHERFYAGMVRRALHSGDKDIASHQMRGVARAVLGFSMPGIDTDIPDGKKMTKAYNRTGAFTVAKVVNEVLLPAIDGEGAHGWNIANIETLDDDARTAQSALVNFTERVKAADGRSRRALIVLAEARKSLESDESR